MDVTHGIAALPLELGPAAVTVGFFDGFHRGHQAVFRRTVDVATQRSLASVAVTFDRHPREVLTPGKEPKLLTTLERKVALMAASGVQALVVLEFTQEFSAWSPQEFVDRVLVAGVQGEHIVVGSNFTFGHKAAGTLPVLTDIGAARGVSVEGVALLKLDGRAVSSSSIREAVAAGDLAWPNEALGRRFAVDGVVAAGVGRGRGLGYPTANLEVGPRMLLPGEGVYAGRAIVGKEAHVAAINVGTNPTFGGEPLHLEAYLLDFDGDLRGRPMVVELWARLREESRFATPEDLVRQIDLDVARTRGLVR